jgi:WD40 repeat protein
MISCSFDTTIKIWSLITGECLNTLLGHSGRVISIVVSSGKIISASWDGTIRVWDILTGVCNLTFNYSYIPNSLCLLDSVDSSRDNNNQNPSNVFACGFENGNIGLIDFDTMDLVRF